MDIAIHSVRAVAMRAACAALLVLVVYCLCAPALAEEVSSATPALIQNLRDSAIKDRADADEQAKRATAWRELGDTARRAATESSDPAGRDSLLADAAARDARATSIDADVLRLRQRADEREQRAQSLQQAFQEQYGQGTAASFTEPMPASEASTPTPPADPAPEPVAYFTLPEVLGLWRIDGVETPIAIVQADPDAGAGSNRVELHSDQRVWNGSYRLPGAGGADASAPLLTFSYKPTADEINRDIPDWARKQVAGQLEWQIEIVALGGNDDPSLEMRWYAGEVRWQDGGAKTPARIVGKGQPRVLGLTPDDSVEVDAQSLASLALKIAPGHDGHAHPIDALTKGQRFWIEVRTPVSQAKELGGEITVSIKGTTSGTETVVELSAGPSVGERPVTYSHVEAITIADSGDVNEPAREPQFMSLPWIFGVTGNRIDLDVANAEPVEFRVEDMRVEVPVFNSWVQRGLARHAQGAERLQRIYESILTGPHDRATKQQAARRLRMLSNYRALIESDALTDVHRYKLGEFYLAEAKATHLTSSTATGAGRAPPVAYRGDIGFVHMTDAETDQALQDFKQRPHEQSNNPTYFNPLVKAFLEGLTGTSLDPNAHSAANGIVWTSTAEQWLARETIAATTDNLSREILKETVEGVSFGMYEGFVTAVGTNDLVMLFRARDAFDRPVATWDRFRIALGLTSNLVLGIYGPTAVERFVYRHFGSTTGLIRASRSTLRVSGARSASMRSALILPEDAPRSLKPQQRRQTSLAFEPNPQATGAIECALPGAPKQTLRNAITVEEALDVLNTPLSNAAVQRSAYLQDFYGSKAKVVEDYSGGITKQGAGRGTCQLKIVNWISFKRSGVEIAEDYAIDVTQQIADQRMFSQRMTFDEWMRPHITDGYPSQLANEYARSLGMEVAEIKPYWNFNVKLRHFKAALDNGFGVKAVVKVRTAGPNPYHAVSIEAVAVNAKGHVTAVRFFDSNIAAVVEMPAAEFKALLPVKDKLKFGILTIYH